MAKIIFESQISEFLNSLSEKSRVIAPIIGKSHTHANRVSFKEYKKGDRVEVAYPTTILPPKEWLLPPTETLFTFKDGKTTSPKTENTIIFGVSLKDLLGIHYLDQIFTQPISDEPYLKRREKTLVVAVDRFSPPKDIPYDVYFQKIASDTYAVYSKTVRGKKLLSGNFFAQHNKKIPKVVFVDEAAEADYSKIVADSKDHPVWDELAEICFGCGICSYVCPLCYCFETEDRVELPIKESPCGERCRNWDSCMLEHFAETSSHNFRPELRDRIYNWYFHKFVRMPREHGFDGCVGCDRCVIYCPAKINYHVTLQRLKKDYEGKVKK